jgi:hypothetical protein
MTIDAATAVELVNMVAGVFIVGMAIYVQRISNLAIFKRGLDIIAASGAIMVIGSVFRAYYTYTDCYELMPWGRAFLVAYRIMLLLGLYVFAMAVLKICGEERR